MVSNLYLGWINLRCLSKVYSFYCGSFYSNHNNESEDILVKGQPITRYYLNQNGDSTIDRIVFFNKDSQIENILLRSKDYIENKSTFDLADKVLEQERGKRKRNKNKTYL